MARFIETRLTNGTRIAINLDHVENIHCQDGKAIFVMFPCGSTVVGALSEPAQRSFETMDDYDGVMVCVQTLTGQFMTVQEI